MGNLTVQLHCRKIETLEVGQKESVLRSEPCPISNIHGARVVGTATWRAVAVGRHVADAVQAHYGALEVLFA